eukprot:gnl/MRDRNA2_/MRDRNA2_51137_c0_seq1.p1 gnl/MRDRNA2_/MRDRNA2_51137_c0~~gnl/MRDRNA2_/MRDRNA2_51137_c0_seq1.p1  ORF type:complete len:181 (-),score=25.45 gnl/MRDRNA2_/MRDRNA2_51137_c0_seq1:115-657(-)
MGSAQICQNSGHDYLTYYETELPSGDESHLFPLVSQESLEPDGGYNVRVWEPTQLPPENPGWADYPKSYMRRVEFWMVSFDRSEGADLGIKIMLSDSHGLIIKDVISGLVREYNEMQSDARCALMNGDRITGVNGVGGSAIAMLRECQKNQVLNLAMERDAKALDSDAKTCPGCHKACFM